MGKIKEAIREITEYVIEHIQDFYSEDNIPQAENMFEEVQGMVMEMDEETFFVALMLSKRSQRKEDAV
jgi:hypothetical protein